MSCQTKGLLIHGSGASINGGERRKIIRAARMSLSARLLKVKLINAAIWPISKSSSSEIKGEMARNSPWLGVFQAV